MNNLTPDDSYNTPTIQMKKISIFLCFLCFLCDMTHAQSLKDLLLKMPQEVCPSFSEYNLLEIVDNQKNGKPMQTRNQFRTVSTMQELTDDYAHLILTKNSEKELKLLTKNDGTPIIMVISTVICDSLADSSVAFYDTSWQPLRTLDYYTLPPVDTFRHVTIDKATNQLTVSSRHAFRLRTDGSDKPLPPQPVITNTFRWSTEENQFIIND